MPKFRIEKDGQVFEVEVAEGEDPNVVLSKFLGGAQEERPSPPAGSIAAQIQANASPDELRLLGANRPDVEADIMRGTGLGIRAVAGAAPKVVAGVSDIGAGLLNLIPAAISAGDVALGGEPTTARLSTGATEAVDELLNKFFPEPETLPEKAIVGGGELALTGGAGGVALAPKLGGLLRAPGSQKLLRSLGDEIGQFFAETPLKAGATELAGGVGTVGAGEVAKAADVGPLGQFFAELAGGVGGTVAPIGIMNLVRRGATSALNFGARAGGERRAAQLLQETAADPAAAAVAAREAPEGVLPARATEDPGLQALEAKVLADDPVLQARAVKDLEVAERVPLERLSSEFGPGTSKQEWQTRVVQETAPEGIVITQGQPDEMLSESFRAFKKAYGQAEGHKVKVNVPVSPSGKIQMPEGLLDAVFDPAILTGNKIRRRIATWLQGRYQALVKQGNRVGGTPENPVFELDSGQLIELRHIIRKQQRAKAKAGVTSADAAAEAELLANADRGLTETINRALPPEASAALRATDAKYANFKTVEEAIRRSGDQGLTSSALRGALKSRTPAGGFARGETGRLGELTEQGASVARILRAGDTEQAERLVRTMNPTELKAAKGDFVAELTKRATKKFQGESRLKGQDLLNELAKGRKVLKAAGFNDGDLSRIERVGRQVQTIQQKSPAAVTELLTDNVGTVMRLLAAVAGSRAGTRALKLLGGTTGAGPSLILAQFGSRQMQKQLTRLTVDKADALIRGAIDDPELFAALLVAPTSTIDQQARAARTIQTWLVSAGATAADITTIEEE